MDMYDDNDEGEKDMYDDDDKGEKEFLYEDCISLLEQANLQEKELRHKRRWLIGLPASLSGNGEVKGSKFQIGRPIPESLLREDDVSYDIIKSFVEKSAGERNTKSKHNIAYDNMKLIYSPSDVKGLVSLIDYMTNQGLRQFAEVLTNGSIQFEKTRWKMKQVIKERLSEVYQKQKNNRRINLSEIHSSLLKNPHNFHWRSESRFIPDSNSYHVAVYKILNVLEDLPTQTLSAMHRKLRGIKVYKPQLAPKKTGWGRDKLIERLRKKCLNLLSKLNNGDSLQEPLAKAMEVASLNLKLIQGYHFATNFLQSSPEINSLQNEIATSIKLLDQRLGTSALKEIKVLLDPDSKIADKNLRALLRNLLTEYLFECGEMDTVPQWLLKIIAIIRRSCETRNRLAEMKVEEEVECILSLSASMKQVLWDLISEHEFDSEFADAYMEDLEDSDADDIEVEEHTENDGHRSSNSDEKVEGTGDNCKSVENPECMAEICSTKEVIYSKGVQSRLYHLVNLRNKEQDTNSFKDTNDEHTHVPEKNPDLVSCNVPSLDSLMFNGQGLCKNKYVAIQAASDEASMLAYRLIGRMLNDFAQIEGCELKSGDLAYLGVGNCGLKGEKHKVRKEASTHNEDGCSILMKAVEELIPSFAKR